MTDTVSKLAAFVFKHGDMAQEVLFRDVEDDGEIPGITAEERDAMSRAEPLLRETWIGILTACRQALWDVAADHPCAASMKTRKTQRNKMFENDEFQVPLVPGKATAGVTLEPWGADEYKLHVWCWTQAKYRKTAEAAVAGLGVQPWRNDSGSFLLTLDGPHEDEAYSDIGKRVAAPLWAMARPVAEAVMAQLEPDE